MSWQEILKSKYTLKKMSPNTLKVYALLENTTKPSLEKAVESLIDSNTMSIKIMLKMLTLLKQDMLAPPHPAYFKESPISLDDIHSGKGVVKNLEKYIKRIDLIVKIIPLYSDTSYGIVNLLMDNKLGEYLVGKISYDSKAFIRSKKTKLSFSKKLPNDEGIKKRLRTFKRILRTNEQIIQPMVEALKDTPDILGYKIDKDTTIILPLTMNII